MTPNLDAKLARGEKSDPNDPAKSQHPPSELTGHAHAKGNLAALIVGSIGVVYGDIGTSPLYALREVARP